MFPQMHLTPIRMATTKNQTNKEMFESRVETKEIWTLNKILCWKEEIAIRDIIELIDKIGKEKMVD